MPKLFANSCLRGVRVPFLLVTNLRSLFSEECLFIDMCEHLQDTVGNTKLRDSPGGSSNRSLLGHTQFHPAQKGAGLETKHAGRKQGHFFPTNQHSRKYRQQGTSSLLAFQMTCQVQGPKTHIQQVQENMLEQRSPTFLASRTGFVEDNFSSDQVRGMAYSLPPDAG